MADTPNSRAKVPDPFTLVIFGASGDLTRRKLVPAVFCLFRQGLLPGEFAVLGAGRREFDDEGFREHLRDDPDDPDAWSRFAAHLAYQRLDYDRSEDYGVLRDRIRADAVADHVLFYLAVPPDLIGTISERLREADFAPLDGRGRWARLIVEKPFGRDLASARDLNRTIGETFSEEQVLRIDHYLGKETVQNLLVLRFANSLFEPLWNQKYVDHVQITVSETIGVEGRGSYYDRAGALRDMLQNHVMHLLCLVAMEPPGSLAPLHVRDEKVKVLRALRPVPEECIRNGVVRAQYAAGEIRGSRVPAYREEEGVDEESSTETFVALKAYIDNWRWAGVPFYLRTGKRMPARITEIGVHFKRVPKVLFNTGAFGPLPPNILAIRIQPNEGISMRFQVKVPGPAMRLEPFQMDFGYLSAFGKGPPDAYERLVLDAALGDTTLFTRGDEIEAAWAFIDPVIEGCEKHGAGRPATYPAGAWGPKEADELIEQDGRQWYLTRRPKERAP
jgi:glucose-6-phosphate 1-dehydrogenase